MAETSRKLTLRPCRGLKDLLDVQSDRYNNRMLVYINTQYNTIQYCTIEHSNVQYSTVLYSPNGRPIQVYGASYAILDHTVSPAIQHRRMCPTLTSARHAGTQFNYPRGIEG